eukprot:Em0071g11a
MASRETEVGHRNHALQQLKQGAEGLSQEETMALRSLLNSYVDVFALVDGEFGKTNKIKHRINIQGAEPVKQPGRLWPFHKREEVRGMLSDMLKRGVIEESHSPWASPIVVVQKKDGTSRFCVDFRRVNALTIKDAQPLLRIDDTLDVLAGSCWFSTLDLASGYWQVEVDDKDREKTAFSTPFGLYQFKVMPFGLCNAPATFQRLMELVLLGLHWTSCLVYLDDIIIFSKSVNEHLRQLEEVLDRLRGAGLKTKPNASATGVGAVLSQVINGHERAVAYASRALTKPERRYCTTRQEMLALVWAAQHFRAYLYGRSFQARTDHQSLKWLRSFKEPEGQVARWLEALAEYDFEVVHRPAGHLGMQKTLAKIRSRFYWVGQRKDVKEWCRRCTECASQKSPPAARGPMKVAVTGVPFQRVAMDIIGPFPKTAKVQGITWKWSRGDRKMFMIEALKPYNHDSDQNDEARIEDSGPVQKRRKVPKPSGVVSPEELESEDEELMYPLMHVHQPDPGQDLNNPVAQPFLVPDNVPELPGDIGVAENAHQQAPPLRRSTRNRKPPDRY